MSKPSGKIAFILERASREVKIKQQMERFFPFPERIQIIPLSMECNIHMLWKQLVQDEFETDIIEVLREKSKTLAKKLEKFTRDDFEEVYLFFDLDIQHYDHIGMTVADGLNYLEKMLKTFDNETEQGKLYISYPMVEAIRDLNDNTCRPASECCYPIDNIPDYKKNSVGLSAYTQLERYSDYEWESILSVFLKRCFCLLHLSCKEISYCEYKSRGIEPIDLFMEEKQIIMAKEKIFILTAFPEFIIDYFQPDRLSKYPLLEAVLGYECDQSGHLL